MLDEQHLDLTEELEHEKEANEGIAEEYRRLIERNMQSKRKTTLSEQLSSILYDTNNTYLDTPEEIQAIVDYVTGPEKSWTSGGSEAREFRQIMEKTFHKEWEDFLMANPGVNPAAAMDSLPPTYLLPPLQPAQLEALTKEYRSALTPGQGAIRARIRYSDLKNSRCSTVREFPFSSSAEECIRDAMEKIFLVTDYRNSVGPGEERLPEDYMFRVQGRQEYIYGRENILAFRYIRECVLKQVEVNLTVEPVDSDRINTRLFEPQYPAVLQRPRNTHEAISISSNIAKLDAHPFLSLWDVDEKLSVAIDELSNLRISVERIKGENLRDGDDVYVCIVVEVVFGTECVCPPKATPWRCCKGAVGAPKDDFFHVTWGPRGKLSFDVPLSDAPRELKLCLNVVAVSGDNFPHVSTFSASQLLDDSIKGEQKNLVKFVNLINPLASAEEEQSCPIFFLATVSVQLFDHAAQLHTGAVNVRMWSGEQRANPIGSNSSNPDKTAIGCRLLFPKFGKAVVLADGEPPRRKLQDLEAFHAENLIRMDVQLRDNKITQLRQVKRVLATDPLYKLTSADKTLLWHYRADLTQRPKALCKLLLAVNWMRPYAVHEVHELMFNRPRGRDHVGWERLQPRDALELLDARYADTKVREYAVQCLATMGDMELKGCVLQLVQVLKYEPYHYSALSRFLLHRSLRCPHIIGHFVFWHLVAEMGNDNICERHGLLIEEFLRRFPRRREFFRQQFVVDELLAAAMKVKNDSKKERLGNLRDRLKSIRFPKRFTLALNPSMECSGIEVGKCKVMDSKKLPLWLVFRNANEDGDPIYIIFKAGDDLRQDLLTLQMLELMDNVWKDSGLDLHMIPYGCVATGEGVGMIEIVLQSDTIANITRKDGGAQAAFREEPLMNWLRKHNRLPADVERCLWNFLYSTAGYTVATYILGIGDRHNDNIMIREDGTLFHIDFGHFLGNFKTKFGFKRETAPFIFTPMYAYMLGGPNSPIYEHFCHVASQAYNVIRRYSNQLIIMFMLMLSTGIPELQKAEDISWLKSVLLFGRSDEEASRHYREQISEALNNKRTLVNDYIHILAH
jgi:hypothetical protein